MEITDEDIADGEIAERPRLQTGGDCGQTELEEVRIRVREGRAEKSASAPEGRRARDAR